MVKIAFVVPVIIILVMVNVVSPVMREQGVDPLAKARSQTEVLERKVHAAMKSLPQVRWDFWR